MGRKRVQCIDQKGCAGSLQPIYLEDCFGALKVKFTPMYPQPGLRFLHTSTSRRCLWFAVWAALAKCQ